jgi:predicted PolB exonuclease-like 3'-5' exonuclease
VAQLLGLPGKLGMSGDRVWSSYQRGELAAIRAYCETDVLNTYLI